MRFRQTALATLAAAFCLASPVRAQTHFTFVNGGTVSAFGYLVGPYNGLVGTGAGAQSVTLNCVDYFHHVTTGQQWDAPNGWAPLQWITYRGLLNYGHNDLAAKIRERWATLNEKTYSATGKMMEKYNVADISLLAGGGEYPNQDGFGWTNGVYLAMNVDLVIR